MTAITTFDGSGTATLLDDIESDESTIVAQSSLFREQRLSVTSAPVKGSDGHRIATRP
ncbi:MAG: hypothetical protein U0165_03980 [Polyangiaceae bacterium]